MEAVRCKTEDRLRNVPFRCRDRFNVPHNMQAEKSFAPHCPLEVQATAGQKLPVRCELRHFPQLCRIVNSPAAHRSKPAMAEIVAFGASVVAFVQLADRVINLSKVYLEALHDCPHDIKTVLVEITSLKALLESLNFLIRLEGDASHASSILTRLGGQNGPVGGCRNAVAMLEKLIPSHTRDPPQKGKKASELLKYLAWPLHQTKATKLLAEISRYKESIALAITTDTS